MKYFRMISYITCHLNTQGVFLKSGYDSMRRQTGKNGKMMKWNEVCIDGLPSRKSLPFSNLAVEI